MENWFTVAKEFGAPGIIISILGWVIYRMASFIVKTLEKREVDTQKTNEALFTSAQALREMMAQKNALLEDKRISDHAIVSMVATIKEIREDLKTALRPKQ